MKNGWTSFVSTVCAAIAVVASVSLLSARPSVVLSFPVTSGKPFVIQAFYEETPSAGFSEARSLKESVGAGSSSVRLRLPVENLRLLRVDFGSHPGRVTAGRPLLQGMDDVALDWRDFVASPDVSTVTVGENGELELVSEDEDPFLVLSRPLDLPGRIPFGLGRRSVRFTVASIAILSFLAAVFLVAKRIAADASLRKLGLAFAQCLRPFRALFSDLRSDRPFLVYMLAVTLLGWGFELANFTMTLDDEVILFAPAGQYWVNQGRWTMFLLDSVFVNVSSPVIPLAMTLVLYALSFCILFGSERDGVRYLLFPVYMVFPTLFHSFSYSALNPGVGIGFFLMATAVRLLFVRGATSLAAGIVLGAVAMGAYQIFLVYAAIGILSLWLQRALRDDRFVSFRAICHFAARAGILLSGSAVLYKIVQFGFKTALHIASDDYIAGFLSGIRTWDMALVWFRLMERKIVSYLFGAADVYPTSLYAYGALVAAAALVLVAWLVAAPRKIGVKAAVAAAFAAVVALPFAPDALNSQAAFPCRVITIMLPVAVTTSVCTVLRFAGRFRPVRALLAVLVAAASVQFLWALNQESFTNLLQSRRDAAFAVEMKSRIDALPEAVEFGSRPSIPVSLVGTLPKDVRVDVPNGGWPDWKKEMIGISGFAYTFRFDWAMRLHTGSVFNYVRLDDISPELGGFVENMPVWPLNGSVAFADGRVIVKFTDYLPPGLPLSDGPSGRRCRFRMDIKTPVNGFDELVYTRPDADSLLYAYSEDDRLPDVSHARRRSVPVEDAAMAFDRIGNDPWIVLKPFRTEEPYVILEFVAETRKADVVGLWEDVPTQCCRYALDAGETTLRLRVPSAFLDRPFRIDLGDRTSGAFVVKSLKVYADKAYTERLCDLNPGMRETLARQMEKRN